MKTKCEICNTNITFEIPDEVIEAVKNDNLVIFAGAGVSTEGKRCFKQSFYSDIRNELEKNSEDISFSDLMEEYCKQINGRKILVKKIKERFEYVESFPELFIVATGFHKEISTIGQIKDIITTNWDDFFEKICGATPFVTGEDVAFWNTAKRRVLKIHGSINNLGSLVITKNDYGRCYEELNSGAIGALMKSLLLTKVIVFFGYSFGDEDFNKILNYIREEMKDFSPHFYIVTLDCTANEKFKETNITPIITDATYFISVLKKRLKIEKIFVNEELLYSVECLLEKMNEIHLRTTKDFSMKKYPEILYTLCYQDGIIHSLERVTARRKTGEYSLPQYLYEMINSYDDLRKIKARRKKYTDVAYIDGYIEGLLFLSVDADEWHAISPFYIYE